MIFKNFQFIILKLNLRVTQVNRITFTKLHVITHISN